MHTTQHTNPAHRHSVDYTTFDSTLHAWEYARALPITDITPTIVKQTLVDSIMHPRIIASYPDAPNKEELATAITASTHLDDATPAQLRIAYEVAILSAYTLHTLANNHEIVKGLRHRYELMQEPDTLAEIIELHHHCEVLLANLSPIAELHQVVACTLLPQEICEYILSKPPSQIMDEGFEITARTTPQQGGTDADNS